MQSSLTRTWERTGGFVERFPDLTEHEAEFYNIRSAWQHHSTPNPLGTDCAGHVSREIAEAAGLIDRTNVILYPAAVVARALGTDSASGLVNGRRVLTADALRPATVLGRAGASFVGGLDSRLRVAATVVGSTGYWVDEYSAPPATTPTIGGIDVHPHTLCATGSYTAMLFAETLNKGSVRADDFLLRDQLAAVLAELDRSALVGNGGLELLGVARTTGVDAVSAGANGAAPNADHLWSMLQAVLEAGATLDRVSWVFSPRAARKLASTPALVGGDRPLFDPDRGTLLGARVFITSNMPDDLVRGSSGPNCSAIICGDFTQLLIGLFGPVRTVLDPFTLAREGVVRATTSILAGIAVRQPTVFSVMLDALCGA